MTNLVGNVYVTEAQDGVSALELLQDAGTLPARSDIVD
jgi:hypothetical protein